MENTPETVHTISETFTLPVFFSTPEGETKIPEPIILPTITVMPFKRVILGLRVISSSPDPLASSSSMAEAVVFREHVASLLRSRWHVIDMGQGWGWGIISPQSRYLGRLEG